MERRALLQSLLASAAVGPGCAAKQHYLNSAAGGRFENVVWALEIDDGEATLVSWSLWPPPNGPAVRKVWRPDSAGNLVVEA